MSKTQNLGLLYILCIGERMFFKTEDRTDRPKNGQIFSILKYVFFCRNKNPNTGENDPIIGEIDATRHSPVQNVIDALIDAGYMEYDEKEKEKIHSQYVPMLKSVASLVHH